MKHGSPYNSTDAQIVLDAIRKLVQTLRLSDRASERQVRISAAQLFVLQKLAAADGPMSVNELAAATLTHQSSVSVVVKKLEKQNLLSRARAATDARRVELSLTPRALKLLAKAPPAAQERIILAVASMPPKGREQLAQWLGTLAREVAGEGAPAMFFEDAAKKQKRSRRDA